MTWPPYMPPASEGEPSIMRRQACGSQEIAIGLVNNMPDGAFRTTENQIRSLLFAAAPVGTKICFRLFTLPQIRRDASIRIDIDERYDNADRIGEHRLDALIVTGAEPTASTLENEVYWTGLTGLIEWAQANTISAIWSCLAGHAVALYLDAITRQPYPKKLSGIYRCEKSSDHPILAHLGPSWPVPHSRKNGLSELNLVANGYEVLSRSAAGGPDVFVKDVGSLFICLQGHPEYDRDTLLREYRRDAYRFLDGTSMSFPDIPENYFDPRDLRLLWKFRDLITTGSAPARPDFPDLFGFADYSWRSSAISLYQGWLEWLVVQQAASMKPLPPQASALGVGSYEHHELYELKTGTAPAPQVALR
jgi:homoserine O-succinyltransferase/O-acetyltransferase